MPLMRYCSLCGNRIRFGFNENENENEYVAWYDSCSEGVSKRIFVCRRCVKGLANRFKKVEENKMEVNNRCINCGSKINLESKDYVSFYLMNEARSVIICKNCIKGLANMLVEEEKKSSVVMVREKLPKIIEAMQVTGSNLADVAIFIQPSRCSILPEIFTHKNNWIVRYDSGATTCYTPEEFEERFEIVG